MLHRKMSSGVMRKCFNYCTATVKNSFLFFPPQQARRPNYSGEVQRKTPRLEKNSHVFMFSPGIEPGTFRVCGHCQRLSPTWGQLAELLNVGEESKVTVAKVDCTQEKDICNENDVTGYPTLKFFKVGEAEGVKFRGIRDLSALTNFINEQLGEVPSNDDDDDDLFPKLQVLNGLVDLTEDTFNKHVSSGNHFVKFYAPWCGHCQKLAVTWEELANSLNHDKSVSISKIDCTLHRSVCSEFEVKGYPTLLWIEDGKKIEKYTGQRSHETLKAYVDKMITGADGSGDRVKKEKPEADSNAVITITYDNFENAITKGHVFVKFFVPWCGHCKALAPTWEELGRKFVGDGRVVIAKVDCTLETNKKLCTNENVESFPSLILFRNGDKISEYEGTRSLDDLYEFVIEQMEKSRDEL